MSNAEGSTAAPARRPRLAFVSPVFLLPANTGGRIRTSNILRGLKGGAFEVTLIGPASEAEQREHAAALERLCDRFVPWRPAPARPRWLRALDLFTDVPVNVAADRTRPALEAVAALLAAERFDVVVFDFVHAAVLVPPGLQAATVCFTHNVEAEIFARHAQTAGNPLLRWMWASQHAKMARFEHESLRRFRTVVAVSERDAAFFREHYGIAAPQTIPTGVDLDFFAWHAPREPDAQHPPTAVFIGSMDWAANIDGVQHFLKAVWPRVRAQLPQARFTVVGRNPPPALAALARTQPGVTLTGFVDDVRPYVADAQVSVIPLRVGGGTRIKAFEAMAMGCPVVSTAIGIEGLDVVDGEHCVIVDEDEAMAAQVIALLRDGERRLGFSRRARDVVEQRFGHQVAASRFEQICLESLSPSRAG